MGLTANDDDDGSLLSRVPVPPFSNEGIMVKTMSTMHHRTIRMMIEVMVIEVMVIEVITDHVGTERDHPHDRAVIRGGSAASTYQ